MPKSITQAKIKHLLAQPQIFKGSFSSLEDVIQEFDLKSGVPEYLQILYANYENESYDGQAIVFGYDRAKKCFFEVNGGHCSCYGLEEQFYPETIENSVVLEYIQKLKDQNHPGEPTDNWYYPTFTYNVYSDIWNLLNN